MSNIKISVVMAVGKIPIVFLERSIESILRQTYKYFEFIVVNDAPRCPLILETLQSFERFDSRLHVFNNTTPLGFPCSINRAIQLSSGDYIARMDADDISLPTRLQEQYDYLCLNPSISLCGCRGELISKDGQIIGMSRSFKNNEALLKILYSQSPLIHPSFFVRKEVYVKLNNYKNFSPGQDHDFLIRAVQNNYVIGFLDSPLIQYRINLQSLSHQSSHTTLYVAYLIRQQLAKKGFHNYSTPTILCDKSLISLQLPILRVLCKIRIIFLSKSLNASNQFLSFLLKALALLVSLLHPVLISSSYHSFRIKTIT